MYIPLFEQEQFPDSPALISSHHILVYKQLQQHVRTDMGRLWTIGIRTGDVVAVLSHNTISAVCLIHAVLGIGAVLLPVNTRLTPDEIRYQLDLAGAKLLLVDDDIAIPPAIGILHMHIADFANTSSADIAPAIITNDLPAVVMFTSGTSGKPKGALLTHGNLYHSAMASAERLNNTPQDLWLCVLPLYHIGGLSIAYRCSLSRMCMVILPRFDLPAVHQLLCDQPISLISLVPTMLYRLLDMDTHQWQSSLRLILLGGAAADTALMGRCNALDLPVITTYGLTEASSQVCTTTPQIAQKKPASVGKPVLFTNIRVVADDGRDCAIGEIGEVVIKGKTVMQGYINNPQATATVLRDGELYTGDMGYLDTDGDLWIVQRRSDLIITGGENVYPAEVEAVLREHPSVRDVAVVGIPDAEWGQKVGCAIVGDIDINIITTFARSKLAGYKIPRVWYIIDALPLNTTGKVDRNAVKALLVVHNT